MTQIRRRVTRRLNRARLQLQLRRSVRPLIVYGVGLVMGILSAIYIVDHLPGGAGLGGGTAVSLEVPDAAGVVPARAELRFKGVPAGVVTNVRATSAGALVTAKLDPEFGKVYRNARAALRPNTPLQDMYIDILERGTPSAGPTTQNDPLSSSRTTSSVKVADVLQSFDGNTRARLTQTLDELGRGMADRGATLRKSFVDLAPLLRVATGITKEIARRKALTTRLVHSSTELTTELGARDTELRRLVDQGARLLGTLQAKAPQLGTTLQELPAALTALQTSFTSLRAVLPNVDGAVTALTPVSKKLDAALKTVDRLNDVTKPAVRSLTPAVTKLRPLAATLPPVTSDLDRALTALKPTVPILDRVTGSVAKCGFVLQRFFQWTASVFAMGDARGVAPRGDAAFGFDTPGLVPSPFVKDAPACAGGTPSNGLQRPFKP